jgi:hypothetical protein
MGSAKKNGKEVAEMYLINNEYGRMGTDTIEL